MGNVTKKNIVIVVVTLLVLAIGVSFAYWTAMIVGNGTEMTLHAGELRIVFDNKGNSISGSVTPGWTVTKTFSVKNEGSANTSYNLILQDLINTFKTTGFLQYKITSSTGYNMSGYEDVPNSSVASDKVIGSKISIGAKETHEYTIEFVYRKTDEDQSLDMGARFKGKIFVGTGEQKKTLYSTLTDGSVYTTDTRTDFSSPVGGSTITEGYNSTGKIYMTNESSETEDASTTNPIYYFAGNPSDNWVKFAGFYWRIIRTDATHGVKLLYAGTSPDTTEGHIGSGIWNSKVDNENVEYMDENGNFVSPGDISGKYVNTEFKSFLENWYETNIGSKYSNLISNTAKYCNDISYTNSTTADGRTRKDYGAINRLKVKAPTYKCPNESDNLDIKVGLITADEVAFAGGIQSASPNTYYYRNNRSNCEAGYDDPCSVIGSKKSWTLSPDSKIGGDILNIFVVAGNTSVGGVIDENYADSGYLSYESSVSSYVVIRPVITLSSEALIKGGVGTDTNPYTIVGTED